MASRRFDELTNPEIEAALARRPLAIIPLGSIEQHGSHLPTGTDTFAALAIAEGVAERLDGLVVLGLPLGVTPIHMGFPGTISLSAATFEAVLYEAVGALAGHGVRQVAFVNWHEGNIPSIGSVASRLTQAHDLDVVVAHACYVAEELFAPTLGGLTHGGGIEAAAIVGWRAELAKLDRAQGEAAAVAQELDQRLAFLANLRRARRGPADPPG